MFNIMNILLSMHIGALATFLQYFLSHFFFLPDMDQTLSKMNTEYVIKEFGAQYLLEIETEPNDEHDGDGTTSVPANWIIIDEDGVQVNPVQTHCNDATHLDPVAPAINSDFSSSCQEPEFFSCVSMLVI